MFPFNVDPKWYDDHWLRDRPRAKRRSFSANVALLAALVLLLAGGGLVLNY